MYTSEKCDHLMYEIWIEEGQKDAKPLRYHKQATA